MKSERIQNGVKLTWTMESDKIVEAFLISDSRIVEMYKNNKDDNYNISLIKKAKTLDGATELTNLRNYFNLSWNEAIEYLEKKQQELGFFN